MKINSNNLKLHKLSLQDSLDNCNFDCGDEDLNNFLFEDSYKYIENHLAIVYLVIYNEELVGYFSLTSDSIRVNKKLEIKHGLYPSVKIGRLAVDKKYRGNGIGTYMLKIIAGIVENIRTNIGIRYLSVDAYNKKNTINFYSKNNFVMLKKVRNREQIPMYLDLD